MIVPGQFSETSSGDMMYSVDNRYMYTRNSRAIGVLWAVFSLCFAIINAVVFVQPQWLGDTATSRGTGYFGLWRSCRLLQDGQDLICDGRLDDFGTIQTPAFRAATIFVGLSVCLSMLSVLTMVLFFFMHSSTVFHVCGWMQLSCAISMMVGVLLFPIGWDTPMVREVCGPESDMYALGQCGIRWAFILALIGVVDCIVLSILAFVLGTRYVKLLPDHYLPNGTKYKGEVNSGFMNGEYLSSKKLMSNGLIHHPQHHHHHHGNSIVGPPVPPPPPPPPPSQSATSTTKQHLMSSTSSYINGYNNGSATTNDNGSPMANNDMERFSEYSQRTSRSSYKSSLPNALVQHQSGHHLHHHHVGHFHNF